MVPEQAGASDHANTGSSKAAHDGKQSEAELQCQQSQLWSLYLLALYFFKKKNYEFSFIQN